MRLTKAQHEILFRISRGQPFCEFLTLDPRKMTFRTLGEFVPAKLNYVLGDKRVGYKTFWVLFKHNLITPSKYKGSLSPQDGITQFHITEQVYNLLGKGA